MANRAKLKKDAARKKRLQKILVAKQEIENFLFILNDHFGYILNSDSFIHLNYVIRLARKAP